MRYEIDETNFFDREIKRAYEEGYFVFEMQRQFDDNNVDDGKKEEKKS